VANSIKKKHTVAHRKKKAELLAAYGELGRVDLACQQVGVPRRTHYNWLRNDPAYSRSFQDTRKQVAQTLEDEAYRRAVNGTEKPVTIAGEREVIREYSDTLLIFLLKGADPDRYRERQSVEHSTKDGDPLSTAGLLRIIEDELKEHPEIRYRLAQRLLSAERPAGNVQ